MAMVITVTAAIFLLMFFLITKDGKQKKDRAKEWKKLYGENAKPKKKTLHERMQE
jgi:hypothetical protein